jgi:hypothetical protein
MRTPEGRRFYREFVAVPRRKPVCRVDVLTDGEAVVEEAPSDLRLDFGG